MSFYVVPSSKETSFNHLLWSVFQSSYDTNMLNEKGSCFAPRALHLDGFVVVLRALLNSMKNGSSFAPLSFCTLLFAHAHKLN